MPSFHQFLLVMTSLAAMLYFYRAGLAVLSGQLRPIVYALTMAVLTLLFTGYRNDWFLLPIFNFLVAATIAASVFFQAYDRRQTTPFVLRRVTHLVVALGLKGPQVVLTAAVLRRLLPLARIHIFEEGTLDLTPIMAAWQLPVGARIILVSNGLAAPARRQFLSGLAACQAQLAGVLETATLPYWQAEGQAGVGNWFIRPSALTDGHLSLADVLARELGHCWITLDQVMAELLTAVNEPSHSNRLLFDIATALIFMPNFDYQMVGDLIDHLAGGRRLVSIDSLL